jgi:hypothetical protein
MPTTTPRRRDMKVRTRILAVAADAAPISGKELSPEHLALAVGGRRPTATGTEPSYEDNDSDCC